MKETKIDIKDLNSFLAHEAMPRWAVFMESIKTGDSHAMRRDFDFFIVYMNEVRRILNPDECCHCGR